MKNLPDKSADGLIIPLFLVRLIIQPFLTKSQIYFILNDMDLFLLLK
jgi:hypothetical protein